MIAIKQQRIKEISEQKANLDFIDNNRTIKIEDNSANNIKGIIFDFDGVIASFDVRFGWPFFNALKKINPKVQPSKIVLTILNLFKKMLEERKIKGLEIINFIMQIGRKIKLSKIKTIQLLLLFGIYYLKNKEKIVPIIGAREVIREIHKEGYKTVLITNSGRKTIEAATKKIPELGRFDLVITKDDVKYIKPNSMGFRNALTKLNLNPREVISIGDQVSDIIVGKKVGIKTIAFASYYEQYLKKHLIEYHPDFILTDIRDLLNILQYLRCSENNLSDHTIDVSELIIKSEKETFSLESICQISPN